MKHTPGPWTFRPNPSDIKCKTCNQSVPYGPWNYLIEGKKASLIAKIWVYVGDPYSDEANAKLIATAPDMLKALTTAKNIIYNLYNKIPEYRTEAELQSIFDVIINKATE